MKSNQKCWYNGAIILDIHICNLNIIFKPGVLDVCLFHYSDELCVCGVSMDCDIWAIHQWLWGKLQYLQCINKTQFPCHVQIFAAVINQICVVAKGNFHQIGNMRVMEAPVISDGLYHIFCYAALVLWLKDCQWGMRHGLKFTGVTGYMIGWCKYSLGGPDQHWIIGELQWEFPLTAPLHSPDSRQMPAVSAVQRGCVTVYPCWQLLVTASWSLWCICVEVVVVGVLLPCQHCQLGQLILSVLGSGTLMWHLPRTTFFWLIHIEKKALRMMKSHWNTFHITDLRVFI